MNMDHLKDNAPLMLASLESILKKLEWFGTVRGSEGSLAGIMYETRFAIANAKGHEVMPMLLTDAREIMGRLGVEKYLSMQEGNGFYFANKALGKYEEKTLSPVKASDVINSISGFDREKMNQEDATALNSFLKKYDPKQYSGWET